MLLSGGWVGRNSHLPPLISHLPPLCRDRETALAVAPGRGSQSVEDEAKGSQ